MRRRNCLIAVCLLVCAGLLAGCGGEYAGLAEGDAVSGSAVSGEAVSGNAIREEAVRGQTKNQDRYPYRNTSHLYYADQDGPEYLSDPKDKESTSCEYIMEYDLSDGSERRIPKADVTQIVHVDDEWVYYITDFYEDLDEETEYVYQSKLWRAPVEGGVLREEKEELILTEESGIDSGILCGDRRYFVYTTGESGIYMKYDMEEKRYIGDYDQEDYEFSQILGVKGEKIILILGSDLVCQKPEEEGFDVISEASSYEILVSMTDTDVFYIEDADDSPVLARYRLSDGRREKLGSRQQLQKLLQQEGVLDRSQGKDSKWYVDHLVAAGDRLYMQIDISWRENDVEYRDKAVCSGVSRAISGDGKLRYEKELTECLKNPEENQKVFTKHYYRSNQEKTLFLSRGSVIAAAQEKIYFCLYDPEKDRNRLACFDLSSGKFKFLTKKDTEGYVLLAEGFLPFKNWETPEYSKPLGLHADMPNNKAVHTLW